MVRRQLRSNSWLGLVGETGLNTLQLRRDLSLELLTLGKRQMSLRDLRLGVDRAARGQDLVLFGLERGQHRLVLGGLYRFALNVEDALGH